MSGDGIWYPISQFNSDTSLTLATPIQNAPSTTATTYSIGVLPLLEEDFHDMIVNWSLQVYFSTIAENATKYKLAKDQYDMKYAMLEDYAGTKQVNVDLGGNVPMSNPNLYYYSNTSTNLP